MNLASTSTVTAKNGAGMYQGNEGITFKNVFLVYMLVWYFMKRGVWKVSLIKRLSSLYW